MAPESQPDVSAVHAAEAMYSALVDGRLDEMLSYLHPKVTWNIVTRPARSFYIGHEESLQLVKDIRQALGEFRVDWHGFTALGDRRVLCIGQVILITDTGDAPGQLIDATLTFRDGLIFDIESKPSTES